MSLPSLIKFLRRTHFIFALLSGLLLLTLEGIFLYHYFFNALTESKILLTLRQENAVGELRMELFEKVLSRFQEKQKSSGIDWLKIHNPFIIQ